MTLYIPYSPAVLQSTQILQHPNYPSTLPPSNVILESMKAYWHECHKLKTTLLLHDSIFGETCLHMNSIKNKGRRGSSALPLFIHKIVWHRNYSLFDKSPQYSSDLEHWSKSNIKITEESNVYKWCHRRKHPFLKNDMNLK